MSTAAIKMRGDLGGAMKPTRTQLALLAAATGVVVLTGSLVISTRGFSPASESDPQSPSKSPGPFDDPEHPAARKHAQVAPSDRAHYAVGYDRPPSEWKDALIVEGTIARFASSKSKDRPEFPARARADEMNYVALWEFEAQKWVKGSGPQEFVLVDDGLIFVDEVGGGLNPLLVDTKHRLVITPFQEPGYPEDYFELIAELPTG